MVELTEEEEITWRTYDKLAKDWVLGHLTSDYWGAEFLKFKKLLPKGNLLEVGCGGGRDAKELIKLGYDYLGTDISSELLKEARIANPGVAFQQVSLYDLEFPEPFDGFWCAAVLLHVPKKRIYEALESIRSSVKKDGIGFISLKEGDFEGIETGHDYDGEEGRFFAYWQNNEFKKVLRANGFEVVEENYRPISEHTKWLTYHVRIME